MKFFLNLIICLFMLGCNDKPNDDSNVPDENNYTNAPIIVTKNTQFGNNWEWLKEKCWRIKLEYHKDGNDVVTYTILTNFFTQSNPLASSGVYVSDPSLEKVLQKVVKEVQIKNGFFNIPVIANNSQYNDKWEWLKDKCWRIKFEYHKDGNNVVTYTMMASFFTPDNPLASQGFYISDSSFDGILNKAVEEVKKKY